MGGGFFEQGISRQRAIGALVKLPLFQGISDDECAAVLDICHGCTYATGELIFTEGAASLDMYVLLKGKVEIHTARGGLLQTLGPGEVFGEMGMICQMKRTAGARAADDCILVKLAKNEFDLFLGRFPRIGYIIMRNLVATLSQRFVRLQGERSPAELI